MRISFSPPSGPTTFTVHVRRHNVEQHETPEPNESSDLLKCRFVASSRRNKGLRRSSPNRLNKIGENQIGAPHPTWRWLWKGGLKDLVGRRRRWLWRRPVRRRRRTASSPEGRCRSPPPSSSSSRMRKRSEPWASPNEWWPGSAGERRENQ